MNIEVRMRTLHIYLTLNYQVCLRECLVVDATSILDTQKNRRLNLANHSVQSWLVTRIHGWSIVDPRQAQL